MEFLANLVEQLANKTVKGLNEYLIGISKIRKSLFIYFLIKLFIFGLHGLTMDL